MREILGSWTSVSLVVGKEWSKPSGGWNGEYRRFGCWVYWWEMSRMARVSEGVCGRRRRMYQASVIRDGGAKEIAGILVWDLKWYVYGIVV